MKILNLYAGIGGNRKLWGDKHEVTAIEYDENIAKIYQENYELNRMCELYGKSLYYAELKDYKSRCEKAIEYINDILYPIGSCVNGSDLPYESIESLLNILQNGDDSQ